MSTAWAIVVAAGEGKRMREGPLECGPRKPFIEIAGKPILLWTLEAVARCPDIAGIVLAVGKDDLPSAMALGLRRQLSNWGRGFTTLTGGARRQDTVKRALGAVPDEADIVVVHDAVRPFATPELFSAVICVARETGAAVATLPVAETVKRVEQTDSGTFAVETIDRSNLEVAQTPQAFRAAELRRLLEEAEREGTEFTDEAQLFDRKGLPVAPVEGERLNIKITTPEDLELAEAIFQHRLAPPPRPTADVRVGSGYDIHPLVPGRKLVVCGVEIPSELGAAGHSDGDAACHAAIDALLGAAAMGDIGRLFPDTDPEYKDARSMKLLAGVCARVWNAGFKLLSLDLTIFLEKPKLAPHVQGMTRILTQATNIPAWRANVKAKTMNGIGPVGEGKAIAAQATVVVAIRDAGRETRRDS